MRTTLRFPAPDGILLPPEITDGAAGHTVPLRDRDTGADLGRMQIIAANVVDDGHAIALTVEVPPEAESLVRFDFGRVSIHRDDDQPATTGGSR